MPAGTSIAACQVRAADGREGTVCVICQLSISPGDPARRAGYSGPRSAWRYSPPLQACPLPSPGRPRPAANAGSTATATGAEAYTAATNDPAGYTLTVAASGTGLVSAGGGSIPNADLTVTETAAGPGSQTFGPGSGAILTLAQTSAASSDSYAENWALAIPGTAAASSYSESFVYLVLGN